MSVARSCITELEISNLNSSGVGVHILLLNLLGSKVAFSKIQSVCML